MAQKVRRRFYGGHPNGGERATIANLRGDFNDRVGVCLVNVNPLLV